MAPSEASDLSLDDLLEDLRTIATAVIEEQDRGQASYQQVQQRLNGLSLHALTYIRFLEDDGFVHYDRVGDQITVTEKGRAAVENDEIWRGSAQLAFAAQLSGEYIPDDTEHGGLGEISHEVDEILDSISEIDLDGALSEASDSAPTGRLAESPARLGDPAASAEPSADPERAQFQSPPSDPPGVTTGEEETTQPEIQTSDDVDATQVSETPAAPATSRAGKSMSQDSFSSGRRLQSSQSVSPAASRAGAGTAKLFEREEEIGSGGIGTVYRARQVKLGRDVAVKEIKEIFDVFAGVQRSDIVDRFSKIIQTQARLLHPNIIQVIDIDIEAKFPFVVMQYAPNGNLRRLIETEGRPPLQIALKYFLQILHALNTAHDNGVTHGGIKPENIVLDHAGNALVTDFGMSAVAELDANRGASQVYVGVGTVAYMSPEQFKDPNSSSVKSDIYSLGIMFYEMLTGKVPGRRSPMPSSFYPDIPRALDDVFDRMSMDDEDDRYGSIAEILADIYASEDVMEILDKKGGFLFLRDPMVHGASGLGEDFESGGAVAIGGGETSADDADAIEEVSSPSDVSEVEASEAVEESEAEEFDEHDEDDEEEEMPEVSEDADVLEKLDKYGELFDEDEEDDDAAEGEEDDDGEE
jgi:hypothetical protein